MAAMLELRGLTKRFGGLTALDRVTTEVAEGSIHAVIGPNGSGKTTLFNLVSGVYAPTEGQVLLRGRDVSGARPDQLAAAGMGRTFQNTRLFASMSVAENVLVARHARRRPWRFDRGEQRRVSEILDFVGLADVARDPAASLPQGQRRLLEIAKILAIDPQLVLLDEPHGGLNHTETARLIEIIRQIHANGTTVLLIEHEMDVVMQLAHDITVLNFGSVLARGTPADIQRNEAVIEAYLGREAEERALAAAHPPAPDPAAAPLLSVNNLAVRFGDVEAVREVSLEVHPREFVTVLGNNGAGKSTTLKAIARLVQPASGSVSFDGRDLLSQPTTALVGQGLALVPERRRLFGGLTVTENLRIGAYGRARAEIDRLLEEVLELFPNLKRLSTSLAFSLSGGEQQMLAIGRALMSRPRLLLLDEPSLGLAPLLVEQVFAKLIEVNRSGTAILLVEQNARMALSVAHRAYVLASGRTIASGPAAEIAADPRLRSAYLGVAEAA
jgi:ABC-type branched-subunit amino acid transport system ATPase component